MSFSSLGLSEALARAVEAAGYSQPTPVQQRAIPAVLQGRDLMVAAQTGTGKTGGFALPVLECLFPTGCPDYKYRRGPRQARALVLTPTRELAAQVHDSFRTYASNLPLNSACIFGGVGVNPQIQALAEGVDVLVACPGRLLDLAGQNKVDLSHVEILVLDEADRMLDMGFIHDVKKILAKLPSQRQNLLFSATFSQDIVDLAGKLLRNPERVEVTPPNTMVERIEQRVFRLPAIQKRTLLAHLVTVGSWEQVLVFTRTKHGANRLVEYLNKHGLPAAAIHGNKSQNARTKALADFKTNEIRILVATDIAARGLDIDQLLHVVNYELPHVEEDYVHRIGRTGRAGRNGEAISLVAPDEEKLLKAIEKMIKQRIPDGDFQDFDLETALSDMLQPESHAAPQKQPRRDKELRSRGRKSKERQAQATVSARDDTKKPVGKRCQRDGDKKKESREGAQSLQTHKASRSRPITLNKRPPIPASNRDPEEFLDDDFDNFGNRADYVSPYQAQGKSHRRHSGQGQKSHSGGQQARNRDNNRDQGNGAARNHQAATGRDKVKKPRNKSRGQGGLNPSRMSDVQLREPLEYGSGKPPRQPLVINKRDLVRLDRLPTVEQLDKPASPRRKGERPALLTRNR